MNKIQDQLQAFAETRPELIFEWNDRETEARGWLVINSLRGGAAGGGTRMRPGLDCDEVTALAKTMEIKFTVSGPTIGGAKSGINFDPNDPRKDEVLDRWFKAVSPILKHYYGTGGDLNVDEIRDVIPRLERFGVFHPQEGVLCGHFNPSETGKIDKIGQLRRGVSLPVKSELFTPSPNTFTVADLITGYGVAESIRHYYEIWNGALEGKRIAVQGWGNVGASAAYYLSRMGGNIVAITDRDGGVARANGFSAEEIADLLCTRQGNALHSKEKISHQALQDQFWKSGAEIFIPAAASRLVTHQHVDMMIQGGLELIASGANVPFEEKEIFFGPLTQYVDGKVALIPDFIANCGMARAFSYLMLEQADVSEESIFSDTSQCIENAMRELYANEQKHTELTTRAFVNALHKIHGCQDKLPVEISELEFNTETTHTTAEARLESQ